MFDAVVGREDPAHRSVADLIAGARGRGRPQAGEPLVQVARLLVGHPSQSSAFDEGFVAVPVFQPSDPVRGDGRVSNEQRGTIAKRFVTSDDRPKSRAGQPRVELVVVWKMDGTVSLAGRQVDGAAEGLRSGQSAASQTMCSRPLRTSRHASLSRRRYRDALDPHPT